MSLYAKFSGLCKVANTLAVGFIRQYSISETWPSPREIRNLVKQDSLQNCMKKKLHYWSMVCIEECANIIFNLDLVA